MFVGSGIQPARLQGRAAWRLMVVALVATLAWPRALPAQPPREVSVHINVPQTVYVGDPFDLQVLVSGTERVEQPVLPPSDDFHAVYRLGMPRSSSTTLIINGQVSRQDSFGFAHVFRLTARRAGTTVIPPFPVVCDGRAISTREVRINVLEPVQSADFKLELAPEKRRIYVGEPIRLSLTWLLGRSVRDVALSFPALPPHVELLAAPDPRGTTAAARRDPRFVEIPIDGEAAVATISQRELNGKPVDAVTIDRILIAREPGTLQVGPVRADFNAVTGQRPRRLLDSPFDDLSILERQSAASAPFEIEVLPLPAEGRPADFSGLVGNYAISASAEPTDVSLGEPINLRIVVSGPPPHDLIPLIDLNSQPAFESGFRLPRDPALPLFTSLGPMFTYPVRPRSVEQTVVPPIELNYFDTTSGRYAVARTAPIAIKVRASTGVDFEFDEPAEAVVAATKPSSRVDRTPLALTAASFDFGRAWRSPLAVTALTVPPAAFAALLLAGAIRRHAGADPARARRRRAVRAARRRLGRAATTGDPIAVAGAISHTLTELAADWFDRPPGSLTSIQAAAMLSAGREGLMAPLGGLLEECDRVRFAEGTTPGDTGALMARARGILADTAAALEARP